MSAATNDFEHPTPTTRSQHRYLFTAKHHGGDKNAAMWLPSVSQATEFSIFDTADQEQITDSHEWLYGVLPDSNGDLETIGTWDEQVAEFKPGSVASDPWHGYPKWPVDRLGPPNRRKQQSCPERMVFDRLLDARIINKIQHKLLLTGRPA
jgi:hypothetical protein